MAKNNNKTDYSPVIRIHGFKPVTLSSINTRGEGVVAKIKKIIHVLPKECVCGRLVKVETINGKLFRYCEYCGQL